MEELIEKFSLDRVHTSGAKFDFEKAKWFNHQWIQKLEVGSWKLEVKKQLEQNGIVIADDGFLEKVISLVKDRCTLLTDFVQQASFFFVTPTHWDADAVKAKWNTDKKEFFNSLITKLNDLAIWDALAIETAFKELATEKNIKPGELQLPLRVMLVGGKFGPPVFTIAEMIGKEETLKRIATATEIFG